MKPNAFLRLSSGIGATGSRNVFHDGYADCEPLLGGVAGFLDSCARPKRFGVRNSYLHRRNPLALAASMSPGPRCLVRSQELVPKRTPLRKREVPTWLCRSYFSQEMVLIFYKSLNFLKLQDSENLPFYLTDVPLKLVRCSFIHQFFATEVRAFYGKFAC